MLQEIGSWQKAVGTDADENVLSVIIEVGIDTALIALSVGIK